MRNIDQVIDQLLQTLTDLESGRKDYISRRSRYLVLLISPLALLIFVALTSSQKIPWFIGSGAWLVIGTIIYQVRVASLGHEYIRHYKKTVIPALLSAIDPNLVYNPDGGISSSTFVDTELYTTHPDRYSTEDLIQGNYGKTFLQLAEIYAEERRSRTDSDGRKETYYVTIFNGLFLIADFHKHFHGRTFILPDNSEKSFGGVARFFQKMGGRRETNLIRLEDPEFENAFAVYATDEVEARYILSTAMLRRVLDMRNRFGKDVRLAFKESCLILAVPHAKPFLEPKTSMPATDQTQIRGMLRELQLILDTIEELDLNTRIWSKH